MPRAKQQPDPGLLPAKSYEIVRLDAIQPHPKNPRQGDVGEIVQLIRANGFRGAITVQRSTRFIIAGNHRWLAARELGMAEIPVIWEDCDDETALRHLLADNRANDLAAYNNAALAELLQQIQTDAGSLNGTGFDGDALDELLADMGASAGLGADESDELRNQFQVLVDCQSESKQGELLETLSADGWKCRALIS